MPDQAPASRTVALRMDPGEARAVHHAIAVAVELLDTVKCPPAAPLYGQGDTLARVARRLDHEIRHA